MLCQRCRKSRTICYAKTYTMFKSYRLERSTMDKIFGKRKWCFTTIANKADSLRKEEGKQRFFNWMMKLSHYASFFKFIISIWMWTRLISILSNPIKVVVVVIVVVVFVKKQIRSKFFLIQKQSLYGQMSQGQMLTAQISS